MIQRVRGFQVEPGLLRVIDQEPVAGESAHGYLEPRRGLNNLRIEGNVLVDRLLIENGTAIGIEVIQGSERRTLRGRHIVLSAGAVHSPTILIRSGIGPAAHLKALGVDIVADLPVGEGFQDHPIIAALLPLEHDLTAPEGFRHTNSCIRYSSRLAGAHAGDMMMIALNRRGDSIAHRVAEAYGAGSVGVMGVWVNECESRGRVTLHSLDPHEQPLVEENMLSAESDRRRLYDGFLRLRALIETGAVRSLSRGVVLGPGDIGFRDLEDYDRFIEFALQAAGDTQHGSCTCRMGRPDEPTTVVDTGCRVLGIDSLYVIDASVMPTVTCANTNLTCIMIAEKMAQAFLAH